VGVRAGNLREGFPVQMGEIQGQVVAGDGEPRRQDQRLWAWTRGNVAVFDTDGQEVWERHTASLIAGAPPGPATVALNLLQQHSCCCKGVTWGSLYLRLR